MSQPFDLRQTPTQHRRWYDEFVAQPLATDVTAQPTHLGGVAAVRVSVDPVTAPGIVLYFHGGGYVVGSARSGARLAAELARRTGGRAYSVEYRLAPEHPHPAAVDDAIAAYAGLLATGIEPHDVVLAGDSAGGGLALATMLVARERDLPQPAAAAVFSPWVDVSVSGRSLQTKADVDPLFTRDIITWYADHYMPFGDRTAPLVSPLFADLAGLPPLLIQVGSYEVLVDDAVRLAAHAARDNVNVTLDAVAGVAHVFQSQFGDLVAADSALDRASAFLRSHLDRCSK